MMVIQSHHQYWEIHFVVILCHLIKSLQVTTSSFVFFLMILKMKLDSNLNIMQQVRIHTLPVKMFGLGQKVLSRLAGSKFWPILGNQYTLTCFHGNEGKKLKTWIKEVKKMLQLSCRTSNDRNLVKSKGPGTVLSMQNVLLGQTKVMQIRQRETLSHQGAIIHEVCCCTAQ